MPNPILEIDLKKIAINTNELKSLCNKHNISLTAVTKAFCGDKEIALVISENGADFLADSRVENIKNYADINIEKWLVRPPMLSEVEELVQYVDVSLNSEILVIRTISHYAQKQNRIHKIILMVELGDIREGFYNIEELYSVAEEIISLPNIELYGIGTNLTCFSFVQYDTDKLTQLVNIKTELEKRHNITLPIVSCGNSATIDLMLNSRIPNGANNLRLGESILFGKERAKYSYLPNTFSDAFIFKAEIVELKDKPSMPWGDFGCDSYGKYPSFTDIGMRKKVIVAAGKQDIDVETMTALDPDIKILGASSDHMMIDVTDSKISYKVGDCIEFKMGYFSLMRASTSKYVKRIYKR